MSSTRLKGPAKRPSRQQVAAAATRQEILQAARRLFASHGYAQTSMADIAEEAGVSIPTIYASVGQKQAVVLALVDLIDSEISGGEARVAMGTATDPRAMLALAAHVNRVLQERFGDILDALRSASSVEPAAATALASGQQLGRLGSARLAGRLEELGALRTGLTAGEAADIVAFLTGADQYATLVGRFGWTFDHAEEWITAILCASVLQAP